MLSPPSRASSRPPQRTMPEQGWINIGWTIDYDEEMLGTLSQQSVVRLRRSRFDGFQCDFFLYDLIPRQGRRCGMK